MENPETLDEDAVICRPSEAQNPFDKSQEQTVDLTCKNYGGFDSNSSGMGVYNVELNRFMDNKKGAEVVDFTTIDNRRKGVKDGSKVHEDEDVVVEKTAIEDSGNGISLFVEVFGPANGLVEVHKPVVLGEHVSRGINSTHIYERNGALLSDDGENPRNEVSNLHCPIIGVSQNGTIDWEAKGENEAQEECKLSIGDLVWVKTKTQSWWPGLIVDPIHAPNDATKSDQRASLLVKYFGNGSCVWCSPLQLKPFVENFEQMSAQGYSVAFNGAVKKAANEFGSRVKSQMTCSCVLKEENQILFNTLTDGNGGGKDVEMGSKMCRSDENSLNLFEPENFLAFVKSLALDVSMPGMLEFEATRNRLYAFYRALGHHQLPMHQLRGTTDGKDNAAEDLAKLCGVEVNMGPEKCRRHSSGDRNKNSEVRNGSAEVADIDNCQLASPAATEYKVSSTANGGGSGGKSGKAYESRERRRSKYLSPPYTDLSFGQKDTPGSEENGAEGGKVVDIIDGQPVGSPSLVNSSGKKLQKKKKSMKAISGHNASGVPSGLNVSSTSMLSELRFAALDCLHSDKSRHFDHVESFFSGFRRWVFLDKSIAEIESNIIQTLHGVEVPMATARGMVEDSTKSEERKAFAGSTDLDTPTRSEALPNVTSKRRRRKKAMVTIDPSTIPNPGFSDVNGNPTNGPFMINFQKTGSLTQEGMSVLKKRRKKASVLPDLNGNCRTPSSLAEGSKASNLISFVDKPEPNMIKKMDGTASVKATSIAGLVDANGNNAKVGSFLKDMQVMGPCSTQDIAELRKEEGLKGGSGLLSSSSRSEVSANQMETIGNYADQNSSFEKDIMDLLSPVGKPAPKKRKRKEKAPVDQIPDLNGKADPISPGNNLPAGESKPPRKRRRRNKPIAGFVPEININYNKVQTHGEASGSALLLRFAQGFPVPSKEALIATFCGFGRIKESETQELNGSIGAQVVFENSSDAGNAFKSLAKSSPFGPALINYWLHHLPAASRVSATSKTLEEFKMPATKPYGLKPNAGKAPDLGFMMPARKPCGLKPNAGEAPDLAVIRKNLEIMTSMLEKAGNDLSPETRAKLETEVKGLLKKVSTMAGSSASAATS